MIGKLEQVALREIWKHEAHNFTSWLADNCEILKEQIGFELTIEETEKSVGSFSADILAKDSYGRLVIIENQLERTDHDHLGKLLTYLSNLDAKVAIWISSDPRPEHINAIDYLNEITPSDTEFFLIKLQAFKIGESAPAPLFTIEAGSSEVMKAVGKTKKELADSDKRRYEFFEQLLEKCRQKTNLFNNVSPVGYQHWVNAGAGKAGLMWTLDVRGKGSPRVGLFFCSPDAETNRKRFEAFFVCKEEIEKCFGASLSWDFKEGRKQQYLRHNCLFNGMEEESDWDKMQEGLVETLIKLEKALKDIIRKID